MSGKSFSYENQNGRRDQRGNRMWNIDVRVDGAIVGEIIRLADGYAFRPKGKRAGQTHPTLDECKSAIEMPA